MQTAGCLEVLIKRAEDHREHGGEGTMKSADRICERLRVLLDGGDNPRMRELQQQRAACAQEDRALPVHTPGQGSRPEYARKRTGRRIADEAQLMFESFGADAFERIMRCRRSPAGRKGRRRRRSR
jgi:hypothetical protein